MGSFENPPTFRPGIVDPDGSNFTLLLPPDVPDGQGIGCNAWTPDAARLLCGLDNEGGNLLPGVVSIRSSDGGDLVRLTTNPYGAHDVPTDVSPDGTQFVFLRFRPGPQKGQRPFAAEQVALFVENIDGTGLRQITPYGVAAAHEQASAQWSPDGQEIISETREGILFVVHPDGSGLKLIPLQVGSHNQPYFAFEPDFSPDGTHIVFCMFLNGQEDLYTAKADGSDVVQITDTPDFENGPDWGTHPLAT
ncbi:MAG TPA: hypothetical protein VF984_14460 [Actinomycetota bacterium]